MNKNLIEIIKFHLNLDKERQKTEEQKHAPLAKVLTSSTDSGLFSSLNSESFDLKNVTNTLKSKIIWATSELNRQQSSVTAMTELCDLIKSASNALVMLEQLK